MHLPIIKHKEEEDCPANTVTQQLSIGDFEKIIPPGTKPCSTNAYARAYVQLYKKKMEGSGRRGCLLLTLERVFSVAGIVVDKCQCALTTEMINALVFLH